MSPIVYTPPKKHECKPPRLGDWIPYPDGEELHPEKTVWECEKCARRWELWDESDCVYAPED